MTELVRKLITFDALGLKTTGVRYVVAGQVRKLITFDALGLGRDFLCQCQTG
jgi:hypothetical protein